MTQLKDNASTLYTVYLLILLFNDSVITTLQEVRAQGKKAQQSSQVSLTERFLAQHTNSSFSLINSSLYTDIYR